MIFSYALGEVEVPTALMAALILIAVFVFMSVVITSLKLIQSLVSKDN